MIQNCATITPCCRTIYRTEYCHHSLHRCIRKYKEIDLRYVRNPVSAPGPNAVGNAVGDAVGNPVGASDPNAVGNGVGNAIRNPVGASDPNAVGNAAGDAVGNPVGASDPLDLYIGFWTPADFPVLFFRRRNFS